MFYKKGTLKNFTKVRGIKPVPETQVFSCEFYEIFKNTSAQLLLLVSVKW